MNKKQLIALPLLALTASIASAATIASQSFDSAVSDTWNFAESPAAYNASGDTWDATTALGGTLLTSGPQDGSLFWGARDLVATGDHTLTFDSVDISGFESVELSFYYMAEDLDANETMSYQIDTGSGFGAEVFLVNGGTNTSTAGWVDTGTSNIAISDAATTVSLRLIMSNDNNWGSNDYGGFDNVVLTGTAVPEPGTYALFAGLFALGSIMTRRRRS